MSHVFLIVVAYPLPLFVPDSLFLFLSLSSSSSSSVTTSQSHSHFHCRISFGSMPIQSAHPIDLFPRLSTFVIPPRFFWVASGANIYIYI